MVSGTDSGTLSWLKVTGQAPMAELADYQSHLNAMTAGQGSYALALSHDEAVPPNVQQQLQASTSCRTRNRAIVLNQLQQFYCKIHTWKHVLVN